MWIIILLFLFSTSVVAAQQTTPQESQQWMSPMPDYPMILSANFAEARPSHLHSGIDIKTGGTEGRRVVAVKDGYISRIGVKPYGYGKVLYITHDDGSVSVYAHLSKFIPSLESYLKRKRYETEQNEIDIFPEKNLFRFKAGDQIAYSGNTGSSGGPHLHFEIRRGINQYPINIIHEGIYNVRDDIRPIISALHFFAVDTIDGVPMERKIASYTPISVGEGTYRFQSPIKLPCKGYFAVEVTDRKNDTQNTMGIYDVVLLADGTPRYRLSLDKFSFNETRYVNSLCVYPMQRKSRNEIFRLNRQRGDLFSGLTISKHDGIIDPHSTDSITIKVLDDVENLSILSFAVQYDSVSAAPIFIRPDNSTKIVSGVAATIESGPFSVQFKPASLFEATFISIDTMDNPTGLPISSKIYKFLDEQTPFFTNATIAIKIDSIGTGMVMAKYDPISGKISSIGGRIANNSIIASTETGGCFCVAQDTISPKITPIFPKGFSWASSKYVRFKVADEFSGMASYSLKVDGKFAIVENEMKKSTLVHYFDDEKFGIGIQHRFELTITDGAGNKTVYTKTYTR